jgi:UDP-N-acetylmuramate--alanine ligase
MEINNINFALNFAGKLHFVGIGGIGMSAIAEVLNALGFEIQGSDINESDNVKRLQSKGVLVHIGHERTNIEGVSYVVISSDVKSNNIEVIAAQESGIPVISRAEMLAEIARFKYTISIAGSHGKTTTTTLMAYMLENCGVSPTVITGGIINAKKTNAYVGESQYLVVEADESDGTFIKIPSFIGVVTNIDPEHLSYYGSFERLKDAFATFIKNLPFYGFAVACIDHKIVNELVGQINNREILTYSLFNMDADVYGYNLRYDAQGVYFDVKINNKLGAKIDKINNIFLPMFGDHNVLNALSTIAVAIRLGLDARDIQNGFKGFEGVKRRFTKVGHFNGAMIIDDYAHHPVEISATIQTAHKVLSTTGGKLIAVVQPHRYSRLADLMEEFASCYKDVELLYVTDVFAAGESPLDGINSNVLISKIEAHYPALRVKHISSYDVLVREIYSDARKDDLILMMGAGSISKWANELQSSLEAIRDK